LPSTGTYPLQARVTDLAGNEGQTTVSDATTVTITDVTTPTVLPAQVLTSDPLDGLAREQLGNASARHLLDLDRSPGTIQSGNAALVYNSDSVHVRPIVAADIQTDNAQILPATITVVLTWNNGTPQTAQTYSTSGFSPGDLLTVAQQVASPVTTTGR